MTLGGTWVRSLTGRFKSPGPGWSVLEDADHVPDPSSSRTFLARFKMAAKNLVSATWGLAITMMVITMIMIIVIIIVTCHHHRELPIE